MSKLFDKIRLIELKNKKKFVDDIVDDVESEFKKYIIENNLKRKTPVPQDAPPEKEDEPIELEPEQLRKIYRFLSLQLHPDKHVDNKELYTSAITRLNIAYKKSDSDAIIELAKEFNIDISHFGNITTDYKKEISRLTEEIEKITERLYWKWFFETNEENKKNLIRQFFDEI